MRIAFALLTTLLLCASSVQASITSNIIPDGRLHSLIDLSADIGVTLNPANGEYELSSGSLVAGDFLAAGIGFDVITRLGAVPNSVSLTGAGGFSILKIRSVTPIGGGLSSFVFDAPTVAEWGGIVDDLFGGLAGLKKSSEGTLFMIFDGSAADFDPFDPQPSLTSSASTLLGAEIAELGFTGPVNLDGNVTDNALGEGWEATGPSDPSIADSVPLNEGILGTSFTVGLTRLEGFGGLTFDALNSAFDGGATDFIGGGTLLGYGDGDGNPAGPWQISNEARLTFRPVPEAASIMIWSMLALAVSGLTGRNRR